MENDLGYLTNMSGSCNAAIVPATAIVPNTGTPSVDLPDYLRNHTPVYLPSISLNTRWDDATWILTSAFIIFTMQSGFGLLESGSVSQKNEVNIMVKNAVDVLFGGISYWMFGYGLSFDKIGSDFKSNHPFVAVGEFFVDETNPDRVGSVFSHFFFHASFATTATTIVSGAMAERTKLEAYILFSFLNTLVYCFPAHWVWDCSGWLKTMGVVDIAGAGAVHLVGGVTGLVATLMLKPRTGRFRSGADLPAMGSPTNTIFGMFMLWWGWLGFNCGSTYGISQNKWKLAARSAACTITASIGGGMTAIVLSYLAKRRKFDVTFLINGVLGSLVSITAMCALAHPWEGYVIGVVGALIACSGCFLTERLKIDDPVSVVPVHALGAIWSLLSVGIFGRQDKLAPQLIRNSGLLAGGGFHLLGIQALAIVSIGSWTAVTSFVLLKLIDVTLGLRVPLHEEILGADLVEHSINGTYDKNSREWRDRDGRLIMVVERFKKGESADELNPQDIRRLRRMSKQRASSEETMKSAFGFVRTEDSSSFDQKSDAELADDARSIDESQAAVTHRRRGMDRLRRFKMSNILGKRSSNWTPKHSANY
ncbi:putative ammonium transporter 2 isoform X2 [Acanthaster planci]|uniref:Ammonium transporter n=1 Tax=Acanthaster planci TaxID=133434 RepID=A0A8B7ZBL1_ACAPL|nr:putative ammonium transporter 2 isoform X2 [Acanthaster planci]